MSKQKSKSSSTVLP